jgi:hypothetical protein
VGKSTGLHRGVFIPQLSRCRCVCPNMHNESYMAQSALNPEVELIEFIGSLTHSPQDFMLAAYEWGKGDLENSTGPYAWQTEINRLIGEHLQDPKTRHTPLRIAVASGNGIGKSAYLSMLDDWGMSTVEDCKVLITAGTGAQLKTKLHPELAKWYRLSINSHWFDVKAQSITVRDTKHADTWRSDLIPWDAQNPDAFSGLHNKRKRIVVVFDEASAIADVIWDRVSGALTDEDTEIIWLVFGNPTSNQGRFAECFGVDKHRWKTYQIDSRTVEGTNKEELRQEVERYGEDSDYIRWRIRGEFPRGGSSQFIANDVVAAARRYRAQGYDALPKILTCDVARFGDDETVIGLRQGRKFVILATYRGLDTARTTDQMVEHIRKHQPDATIIDGDGIGGAVIDQLKALGFKEKVFEFHGGAAPNDPNMYLNKRAECWGYMREWLEAGAQIPDSPDLERQLTGPNYYIVRGKTQHGSIFIEAKDDMKKRGLSSPDIADALMMSFSVKLAPKAKPRPPAKPVTAWS